MSEQINEEEHKTASDLNNEVYTREEQAILNKTMTMMDKAVTGYDKSLNYDKLSSKDIYAMTALASTASKIVTDNAMARNANRGDSTNASDLKDAVMTVLLDSSSKSRSISTMSKTEPEAIIDIEVIVAPGELTMGKESMSKELLDVKEA